MHGQDYKNDRIMRWIMYLQAFNCCVTYVKERLNSLADFLSRDLLEISDETIELANVIIVEDDLHVLLLLSTCEHLKARNDISMIFTKNDYWTMCTLKI